MSHQEIVCTLFNWRPKLKETYFCFRIRMETAPYVGTTLRVYYRCDKVIKDNLEGEVLWTGPSEKHVLVIETEPRDYLTDLYLVDSMKKKIFCSLKQQPYVQALLQEGDLLGLAQCEILYDHDYSWFAGYSAFNQTNLSRNVPIAIKSDDLGTHAELWITMTLVINSPDLAHSISPIRARLHLGPGGTYNCGDTGDLATNAAIRAQEDDSDDDSVSILEEIITIDD